MIGFDMYHYKVYVSMEPKFKYLERITFKKGFYQGLVGTAIKCKTTYTQVEWPAKTMQALGGLPVHTYDIRLDKDNSVLTGVREQDLEAL